MPVTAAAASPAIEPPRPRPARTVLPLPLLLRAIRRDVLATWGAPAYELPVVSRPFLGRRSFLVNEPAAIRRILVEAPDRYVRPESARRLLRPMLGDGLFLAEGEEWRRQRRLVAPAFAPRETPRTLVEAARLADAALDRLPPEGRHAVDLLAWVQKLTLEVAARALFGIDIAPFVGRLRRVIGVYGGRRALPGPGDFLLPAGVPGIADLARRRTAREFRRLIAAIVADRARRPVREPPADLFDALRLARPEDTGSARRWLEDQVATLLVAGHETTALLLFWAFHLLALDPRAQERAAAEAMAVPADPEAMPEGSTALRFTRALIDETLRLYPPALSITREATAADRLAGEGVAPGDLVVIAPWVLHRHRRLWLRPDSFLPERFLEGGGPVDRFAFLPFGAGPRVCVGARFALDEAVTVLTRFLRRYRVELVRPRPVLPVGVVTVHPDHAPPFRLRRRAAPGRS